MFYYVLLCFTILFGDFSYPVKHSNLLFFGTFSTIILRTKVIDQKFCVQKKAESPFFQNKVLSDVFKANRECCKWIHNITPLCTLKSNYFLFEIFNQNIIIVSIQQYILIKMVLNNLL